ncbi:head-tail connector protein [Mesobacillus subterraneus]|uniref:head-tail connector protein n=1 Tax=Mesobacillus subterraneus TaxID=285983 RepID=UPI001CFD5E65|nr:head-tail connector protein [Mesobacillus subterraneus]WLR53555.1 head-tail connector protein [Mesobacillus subterraneus]
MLLEDIKKSLRVSHYELDDEITDLIEEARADLILSGVSSVIAEEEIDVDPLIKRAIKLYAKADFEEDKDKSEKYQRSYDLLKQHLSLSADYSDVPVV